MSCLVNFARVGIRPSCKFLRLLVAVANVPEAMDGDVAVESVSLSLIAIPPASSADLDVEQTHITTSSSVDISTSVAPSSPSNPQNLSPNGMQSPLQTTEASPQIGLVAVSKAQLDTQPESSNLDDTVLNVSGQLDLLDHQSANGGIADGTVTIVEEGQEWTQETDHEVKRVKVGPGFRLFHLVGSIPRLASLLLLDAHHIKFIDRCTN